MKLISLLSVLLLSLSSFSQSIERQVIASTGGYSTNAILSTSYSVGESVIQTTTAGIIILTQGFEQSEKNTVGIDDWQAKIQLKAYPNPTTEKVYIEMNAIENSSYSVWVVDALGKLVVVSINKNVTDTSLHYQLDFSPLEAANYFVVVKNEQTNSFKTIQINKCN